MREKELEIKIQLDEEMAQGMYSNLSAVNNNGNEFTFDFMYLQPQQPKAKVRARIISSPRHAKQLMLTLQENIRLYESRFGKIELIPPPQENKILQ